MENQETVRDADAQDDRRQKLDEIGGLVFDLVERCSSATILETLRYVSTLLRQANQALVEDPILQLGQDPIDDDGVTDSSVEHDRYIYRQ